MSSIKRLFTVVLVVVLLTGVTVALYVEALQANPVEAGRPLAEPTDGYALWTDALPDDVRRAPRTGYVRSEAGTAGIGYLDVEVPVGTCSETLPSAEG